MCFCCSRLAFGARLFLRRVGAIRRGSRPPQKKRATCIRWHHARVAFVGAPTPGRSFSGTELAPFAAGRASHRKARRLHKVASSTGCFRGRPALGAKLFSGAGLAPFAAGRGSHRKSVRRAQRSGMYGLDLWEPRPRGEVFWAPSRRHSPRGRGSHRKSERPAQRSAMYGLDLWGVAPRTGCFRERPDPGPKLFRHRAAPFAAGRASHVKQRRVDVAFYIHHAPARWIGEARSTLRSSATALSSPASAPSSKADCNQVWERLLRCTK